jgi:ATP synthase protein I
MKAAMADDPNRPPKKNDALGEFRQAESILQQVLAVPAGAFVGLAIGYLIDRHFHTNWIAVTLMLLGAAGGFIQVFRYLTRNSGGRDGQ